MSARSSSSGPAAQRRRSADPVIFVEAPGQYLVARTPAVLRLAQADLRPLASRLFTLGIRVSHNAACEPACDDRGVGVSVLIVDDHDEFRRSARAQLEADGYTVVGEARDGDGAIAEAERLCPEVVLPDIRLPGIDGFAVAERLGSSAHPPAGVLISGHDARSYGPRLPRATARGSISKADLSGEALAGLVR